ncbi:MAG: bifunctional [glutamine synthetase] adenylyltransferase/[glutamine synthetase]-adenylyl-L-tyrosine phosphorylase [Actinobacteria bacterium]|nr:bifunctional [glutamine synthetase] adenylyltransferase/[glutamine synthetase]-adenylyl-L-tyrosine phosphorylase [Actinomycetota bacterium]
MPGPQPAPLRDLDADIDRSAAPAFVRAALQRIAAAQPNCIRWFEERPEFRIAILAVTGASRSLTRLLEHDASATAVLGNLGERPNLDPAADPDTVMAWKKLEFLRIAARDLAGLDELETVGANLTRLADDVFAAACRITAADDLAVIAMGKYGGRELNYASDVDIMLVGDGSPDTVTRNAKAVVDIARRCFRVDLNLRPEGRDGPLVRSLESYEAYWDRWAKPWEFQALLKARAAPGNEEMGQRFYDTAQRWLWSHPFGAEALRELREMKARAEQEIARRGLAERELKLSPGGIRDIEFTAQLLQLVHGQLDPGLRSPTTLTALHELGAADYVEPDDARALSDAYRFLRTVEHRVQLVDEQQTHTVPDDKQALDQLARVLGSRDTAEATAVESFMSELRHQKLAVRNIHERVYFRPLLEAFSETEPALSPKVASARLRAFGFTDAKRTQAAVQELTRGLNRSSRLMQQMLPLLLDWLSGAPDPDLGLLMLRNVLTGAQRRAQLVEAFRDSPDAARQLCLILGTSRLLGDTLVHNPDLVERLPFPERLRTHERDDLVDAVTTAISWREDEQSRQDGLRRWKARNELGIAARDIFGASTVETVGSDLTSLAEASVEAALASLEPTIPFAVLAMGRFGGGELSYASDLDVLFVYDGSGSAATEEANRLATRLLRFLGGATPADQIYAMDADLRPEGKLGAMARNLDSYEKYWRTYALVWERQAMTRARPVAGDRALGAALLSRLEPYVWDAELSGEDVREIRRLKARVERERVPAGEDPRFHLKLGRGSLSDVEWTVQLLQLQHGIRSTGTIRGMDLLERTGLLAPDDGAVLRASYRFCEETRNRWYLVNSGPADSLPTQPESLLWLARSLHTGSSELREHYRRVTRRARRVVEKLFYGQPA